MSKSGFTITTQDRAIAKYIWKKKLYTRLMDDAVWIDISKILMDENWKKLKHRFLTYVVPNLKNKSKFGEIGDTLTQQLCNRSRVTRSVTRKSNQASMSSVCFDSCYESHNPVSPETDNTNFSLNVGCSSRNSERSNSTLRNNDNLKDLELKTDDAVRANAQISKKRTKLTASDNKIEISNRKANSTLISEVSEKDGRSPSKLNNNKEKNVTNTTKETKIYMWPCCNCLELNELCPGDRNYIFKRRCENCNTKQIIVIGRGIVKKVELFSNSPTEKDPADPMETAKKILLPDVSHYEYFF